jgi:trigger factor
MQVSVEKTGVIARKMTVSVPAERMEEEILTRLKNISHTVRIPGFRPGKAPLKVVDSRYRREVTDEVAGGMIDSSFREAVEKEDLKLAAQPDITPQPVGKGEPLEYTADFDIFPEFGKLDLKGVSIKIPECEIGGEDIDKTIETMRKQKISWEDNDKEADIDDRVLIDFVGTIDGEPFDGGSGTDFAVVIGAGQLLPEFESGLVGAGAGDDIEIDTPFPENYHNEELAGKAAVFAITVKQVQVAKLPEVDEEFAREFGIADGDVSKVREEVAGNLEREVESRVRSLTRARAFTALLEANQTDLPRKMVHEEVHRLMEEQKMHLKQQGVDPNLAQLDHSQFEPEAKRRVGLGLIMMALIDRDGIRVDADRVRARIESMASGYEKPEEFIAWYYGDKQRLGQIESVILEEQVVETLVESADSSSESLGLDELLYGNVP